MPSSRVQQLARMAFLALLLAVLVSALVSPFPQYTLRALAHLGIGLVLYGALVYLPIPSAFLTWLWWGLIVVGGLLCVVGPAGIFVPNDALLARLPLWRYVEQRLPETFNANVVAGALVVLLPFGAARAMAGSGGWRSRLARLIALGTSLAMVGVLLVIGSRGALLAAACSGLLLPVLYRPRTFWSLLVFAPLAAVGATLWMGWSRVLENLMVSNTAYGLDTRMAIWRRALYILRDFPLVGPGLGCFEPVVARMYPLSPAPKGAVPHAHNLLLQVGVDLGLPGLAAYLVLWGLAAYGAAQAYRAFREHAQHGKVALSAACLASLAGMGVHGLLDAVVWGNKGAFLAWVVLGLGILLLRWSEQTTAEMTAGELL